MEKFPQFNPGSSGEEIDGGDSENSDRDSVIVGTDGESLGEQVRAVNIVHDHFPDDISPKEHFEPDPERPFQTEDDYRGVFSLFEQVELVPVRIKGSNGYRYDEKVLPCEEVVKDAIELTEETIRVLTGEGEEGLPRTDVAIYLDKSARPVSWFVNEFWESVTSEPRPRTEHLAIDRKTWFQYLDVNTDQDDYIEGTGNLAGWEDMPIHDITKSEIVKFGRLLKDGIITHDDLEHIDKSGKLDKKYENKIITRAINALFAEENVDAGEITTQAELDTYIKRAVERVSAFLGENKLKNIYNAFTIAMRLRGLFVLGGLSEEDLKNPERIMDLPTGMDGKNITIIDEVERSGATKEIAMHFISWAFPEAASVNFHVFMKAKRLADANSPQDGQMLKIPFWYSLLHDDGLGRGILDLDTNIVDGKNFYERYFEKKPNNVTRAAKFGSIFLGAPMIYEQEQGMKSLRFREQIARLRVEYEKGHI